MEKKFFLLAVLLLLYAPSLRSAEPPTTAGEAESSPQTFSPADSLKILENNPDYTELTDFPHVTILLKYATTDNFMGINMYGSFNKAFLHKDAAVKFRKATEILAKEKPGWSFLIFDALRPRSVQWLMWNRVKDTPQHSYVADANRGSVHNYGFALDISLADENGKELDMGTPFDTFSKLAEPKFEDKFLKEGKLRRAQIDNRLILRNIMEKAGFKHISNEWWHFDGLPQTELEKKYHMVE